VKDTDIIAAIAPDAVSLMDKAIAEIKRLRQENATLTAEHDALRAERDEVRKSYCSLMEAYRGGNGRVTANKLGWGYLFEEDKPCQ
jgi:FtsZ-binding cell division protein ZapB